MSELLKIELYRLKRPFLALFYKVNILKVKYPKGSSNPSGPIVGGVGFYAKPINLVCNQEIND